MKYLLSMLCAKHCSRHLECISKQKKENPCFLEAFCWNSEERDSMEKWKEHYVHWKISLSDSITPSSKDPIQVENYSTRKHYDKTVMKAKILNITRVIHKTHCYIFLCKFLLVFSSNRLTLSLDSSSRNTKSFISFSFSVFWSKSSDT